jgi:hypothetical protein
MEENPLTPEQAVEQVYAVAANMMVRENKGPYEVQQKLISIGLNEESARIVVENLERQINEAKKNRANKDMLYGGLWFFGGLIVTLVSLSAASGGGSYVVAYGAIIFGGIQFFRGLLNNN